MSTTRAPLGTLLRDWRRRRRLSQLDLALEAGVSARHLSFLETGRSQPSREMVFHLAEELDVPLRDRNQLLLAAGYAPVYEQRPIDAPEMAPVREALDVVLKGHEPYPALVVDRGWNLVLANDSVQLLTADVAPELLEPPLNVLRASLHPEGVAPRIARSTPFARSAAGRSTSASRTSTWPTTTARPTDRPSATSAVSCAATSAPTATSW